MDWRMDKSSWVMIAAMLASMIYFIVQGAGNTLSAVGYLQAFGIGLITVVILIALMSIPVLIYCYFVKKIPDIDYSIRAAFLLTLVGIISELIS